MHAVRFLGTCALTTFGVEVRLPQQRLKSITVSQCIKAANIKKSETVGI